MYEVGKVYIWHNQVGRLAYLNGTETTVVRGPMQGTVKATRQSVVYWVTDVYDNYFPRTEGNRLVVVAGDLRPKDPPKGEQKIMEMFNTNNTLETV